MKISIVQGDITQQDVDAIVNAAKPSLLGGSGVDGAIHKAAGPRLREACQAIMSYPPTTGLNPSTEVIARANNDFTVRCQVGKARWTPGFNLLARHVIHTVGPVYDTSDVARCEEDLLSAYESSLWLAEALGCRTVAFPAISCGVYGYPLADAADVAMYALKKRRWLIDEVRFVLFLPDVKAAFDTAAEKFGLRGA